MDRTALFFIIIFILHLSYWLWYSLRSAGTAGAISFGLVFTALLFNFCIHINVRQTHLWWYDQDDKAVMKKIAQTEKGNSKKIKIWVNWMQEPSFKYNAEHYYKGRFDPITTDQRLEPGKDTSYDYYYMDVLQLSLMPPAYKEVARYAGNAFILLKK